jgi:hypothetical protein
MSVVASFLRRTIDAARLSAGRITSAGTSPFYKKGRKAAVFILSVSSYRLGIAKETRGIKEVFIIVNRQLTITKPLHGGRLCRGRPIMAGQLRPRCGCRGP